MARYTCVGLDARARGKDSSAAALCEGEASTVEAVGAAEWATTRRWGSIGVDEATQRALGIGWEQPSDGLSDAEGSSL